MVRLRRPWLRLARPAVCLLAGAAVVARAAPIPAEPPAAVPAAPQPAAAGGGRTMEAIVEEFTTASQVVNAGLPGMRVPRDPARRVAIAGRLMPAMKSMARLMDEIAAADPRMKLYLRQTKQELTALMALLGDDEATTTLKKIAVSNDREEAASARAWVIVLNWDKARTQPPVQEKLVKEFIDLARGHRTNDVMTQAASLLIDAAATPVLGEQVEQVVTTDLTGPMARQLAATIARGRRVRVLVNQPLVVEGRTVDGRVVTTADWKGKVVLVDFWATWSPPCLADLPRLKTIYADNHAKGFEVLGVSSDHDADNFKAFLGDNKDMPWPQLFDPAAQDAHPLVPQFGIASLPTMFLIDRRGVVRSVTAVRDLEDLLPKLLAEK